MKEQKLKARKKKMTEKQQLKVLAEEFYKRRHVIGHLVVDNIEGVASIILDEARFAQYHGVMRRDWLMDWNYDWENLYERHWKLGAIDYIDEKGSEIDVV